ncbi:hypothetical protein GMRT_12590 [Giardia muris]|uniref:Cyclin N-terminal domain-containing protein n=1 Tax=Giardia muris TaxID=5742 RepID=A0A4Z1SY72_GIAMU|nr:hypothetical protein GMRT_12590 [Giardia muris]|eukprot:TNJ28458.1 hypothetical protein GMRT_12590 [Giardia muris]
MYASSIAPFPPASPEEYAAAVVTAIAAAATAPDASSTLYHFVAGIVARSYSSPEVVAYAALIAARTFAKTEPPRDVASLGLILAVCLSLSQSYLYDECACASAWAELLGLAEEEVVRIQGWVLMALDWDIHFSAQELGDFWAQAEALYIGIPYEVGVVPTVRGM